jgi:tRNA pseudouridine55 synthase
MDGLLVIDKPVGPTSHDVVARVRRTLQERHIGHTGTLDPAASGVLPLVVGRATRLARFLSAADKTYIATVRLGISTDSYDAAGTEVTRHRGPLPDRDAVERALALFTGTILQHPPAFSAKRIEGERSHRRARRAAAVQATADRPPAAGVIAHHLRILGLENSKLDLEIVCSAGFYVRSLAHDLGTELGVGAHLEALRRIRSGDLTAESAVPLGAIDGNRQAALDAMIPMRNMLASLPAVWLTTSGVDAVRHGRMITPETIARIRDFDAEKRDGGQPVRLLDPDGELLGLGRPIGGGATVLHPFVVLVRDLM